MLSSDWPSRVCGAARWKVRWPFARLALAGTLAIFAWLSLARLLHEGPLSRWTDRIGLAAIDTLSGVFVAGLALSHGLPRPRSSFGIRVHPARALADGLLAFRLEFLLIGLVACVYFRFPELAARFRLLLAAAAWLSARRRVLPVTGSPAWPLVTLALALGVCATYLATGSQLSGPMDHDSAYYAGVARHISETSRFEEPIVWHHLLRYPKVTHPPFDYWPAWPSLWLIPIFKLWGAAPRVLGLSSAAVACASVLLFWYLVSVARPFRSAWLQVTALLLFAYSPALAYYRFVAETVTWTHVWSLASLIALAVARNRLAAACAFLLFLARPDTFAMTLLLWGFASKRCKWF
jgi:hypothetical protein